MWYRRTAIAVMPSWRTQPVINFVAGMRHKKKVWRVCIMSTVAAVPEQQQTRCGARPAEPTPDAIWAFSTWKNNSHTLTTRPIAGNMARLQQRRDFSPNQTPLAEMCIRHAFPITPG